MKKKKKIITAVFTAFSIMVSVLFLIFEALNFLFQGTIYNYYVDKALVCEYENDFMQIGLKYKNIGVIFSYIGIDLLKILLFTGIVWLIILALKIVRHFVNSVKQSKASGKIVRE